MSDRIQSIHIEVRTKDARTVEGEAFIGSREELRLAIAQIADYIESELHDRGLLHGQHVTVEHEAEADGGRTFIAAAEGIDLTLIPAGTGGQPALWLPNDDGYGDGGSRIYADQLADTLATLNRAATIIHERTQR